MSASIQQCQGLQDLPNELLTRIFEEASLESRYSLMSAWHRFSEVAKLQKFQINTISKDMSCSDLRYLLPFLPENFLETCATKRMVPLHFAEGASLEFGLLSSLRRHVPDFQFLLATNATLPPDLTRSLRALPPSVESVSLQGAAPTAAPTAAADGDVCEAVDAAQEALHHALFAGDGRPPAKLRQIHILLKRPCSTRDLMRWLVFHQSSGPMNVFGHETSGDGVHSSLRFNHVSPFRRRQSKRLFLPRLESLFHFMLASGVLDSECHQITLSSQLFVHQPYFTGDMMVTVDLRCKPLR